MGRLSRHVVPARLLLTIGLALFAAACVARFEMDGDEARIPDGPLQAIGEEPTGPMIHLGSGMAEETGWRFVAYESGGASCLQVELNTGRGSSGTASCAPAENLEAPLSQVSAGEGGNGVAHIHGVASRDVSEVSVRAAGGRRIPARLYDLQEIGFDAQAFFALIPAEADPLSAVALDAAGEEVGREAVSIGHPREPSAAGHHQFGFPLQAFRLPRFQISLGQPHAPGPAAVAAHHPVGRLGERLVRIEP